MRRLLCLITLLAACWSLPAQAANCSALPYTLTNGQTADANQVMANFNSLLSCSNSNLAKNGANSDITSLAALSTPLSVLQGGTGTTTVTGTGSVVLSDSPTLTGTLTAATGTFSGVVSGTNGTFSGAVTGATGTITGLTTVGSLRTSNGTTGSIAENTPTNIFAIPVSLPEVTVFMVTGVSSGDGGNGDMALIFQAGGGNNATAFQYSTASSRVIFGTSGSNITAKRIAGSGTGTITWVVTQLVG